MMQARPGHWLIQGATSSTERQLVRTRSIPQQKIDEYAHYEAGLDELRKRIGKDSVYFSDLLIYEQRIRENIHKARRYGDPEIRQAERTEVIERLNELT